jgi:starch phosphorylase
LRWAWNHDALTLFRRLDSDLWETTDHNPVEMLGSIDQARLEAAAGDESFLAHLDRVARDLDDYLHNQAWFQRVHGHGGELGALDAGQPLVAYLSAEFGLTECLSIFAGGLGLLAGDHLKSASDLGVPLVGVGLLYQQGYLRQQLDSSGWQHDLLAANDFYTLPLALQRRLDGSPVTISVEYPGRTVTAQVWRANVGRLSLYLLDTNIAANRADDRSITDQLYGGDNELRLKQEILLGIGGYRTLEALGLQPAICHMNEGHSAFIGLERARWLMEQRGLSFDQAREAASAGLIFTTHTAVPAGHDQFTPQLIDQYLTDYYRSLGLTHYEFMGLGRTDPNDEGAPFSMTVLAMRMAAYSNAVSKLHGEVTRDMMQNLWPGLPRQEVPIGHVTNGVHFQTWISLDMEQLYDRYLGPRWRDEPADQVVWQRAGRIAAEELWRTHERRRERLVAFARRSLRNQLQQRGATPSEIDAADEVLDPEALTIGFARRFATYKRAGLLLRDLDRLNLILNNPQQPVQIIFAGKAHPRDTEGKELIKQVVSVCRQERFRRRMVFLEDYDIEIARYLVQGVDVWLNTPRRPLEASGTSGMKAMANGALNLSVLDGWWDEAWGGDASDGAPAARLIGWAIGTRNKFNDPNEQDQAEADALYALLEHDVVPTFYDRSAAGSPHRWVERMKASISQLCYFYNTHRMVQEYTERFYLPAAARYWQLMSDDMTGVKELAAWRQRVRANWQHVRVETVDIDSSATPKVGDAFDVVAEVSLGGLAPEDVAVELYCGSLTPERAFVEPSVAPMNPCGGSDGRCRFEIKGVQFLNSGLQGCTVRVMPHHPHAPTNALPGYVVWADGQ